MKKIFLLGDIHGSFKPVRDFHLRNNTNKEYNNAYKVLILLGDSGLNFFFNHRDEEFKKKLGSYPFIYFVVRGNHEERPSICMQEDPNAWDTEEFFGNTVYVEKAYPYIKYALDTVAIYDIPYAKDYMFPTNSSDDDIEIIKTYRTLIIPGAYSVDKYKRLRDGWSWFPQEQLSAEEMQDGIELLNQYDWKVDLVLSHTCPIMYEPTDLFLSVVDQSMVEKNMERYLGQIEYGLGYQAWVWGHYHAFRDYPRVDGKFRTMLFNDAAIELNEYMNGEINKL